MEDLKKVNSMQIYQLWKNFTIGVLTVVMTVVLGRMLPFYLNPVVSLICSAVLYTLLYNNRLHGSPNCMLIPYAMFYCMIAYTFVSIVINVLYVWGIIIPPKELVFFNNPYVPALVLCPVSLVTLVVIFLRRHSLTLCVNCRLDKGDSVERGQFGRIISVESMVQLKNLIVTFGVLSALVWLYYYLLYVKEAVVNGRDWYVFSWLLVIYLLLDELYFIFRYYNLYLDLKENDEIITPEEINDMTAKTYIRFYVICGERVYLDPHSIDVNTPYREVLDTPFFTKRTVNGIRVDEVRQTIQKMTGVSDGELRFFFGRKSPDIQKHSLLRYFYFINPGEGDSCPAFNLGGEWIDFGKLKYIYQYSPTHLSRIACGDLSRLSTIMITEKVFDENGNRKSKIRSYNPNFTFDDVRKSNLDFQDDKWIRISLFNADTRMFKVKRWFRNLTGSKNSRQWQ